MVNLLVMRELAVNYNPLIFIHLHEDWGELYTFSEPGNLSFVSLTIRISLQVVGESSYYKFQ